MTINHALFFFWNGPREGRESHAMETFKSVQAFWTKRREAGDIASFENVILASTGNADMPVGFLLVTGDRAKLQQLRWENEEFLTLHTQTMVTMKDYGCIDGYAGEGHERHMQRLSTALKAR